MNPFVVNCHGEGWPLVVQIFVRMVWTLNPGLVLWSGCGQYKNSTLFCGSRISFRSDCLLALGLCMDVFVTVCFYPPDLFLLSVLVKVYSEIKESNHFVYVSVCLLCSLPLCLLFPEKMKEVGSQSISMKAGLPEQSCGKK